MAATRTLPDPVSHPAGYDPGAWATLARAEIEALWNAGITWIPTIAGTADAITGVCSPVLIGTYVDGQTFRFTPTANNTTAVTVNWDGKGAVALRAPDGTALVADDLVADQPVECWYDSVAGYMRMSQWSLRYLAAATLASITSSLLWEEIGDTTISSPVAQVEHLFTAGAYSKIVVNLSGVSPAPGTGTMTASLRQAGGAIVSLTSSTTPWASGQVIAATDLITAEVAFLIDLISATKYHHGAMVGGGSSTAGAEALTSFAAVGGSATAPDRIRFAFSAGNIDAGRLITKGLVA